jgi:hypothetical protein
VNKWTQNVIYTLPLTTGMVARLVGEKIFSELDLCSTYHQLGVHKESQEILGFMAPDNNQYIWTRMPFGLKNALTHF